MKQNPTPDVETDPWLFNRMRERGFGELPITQLSPESDAQLRATGRTPGNSLVEGTDIPQSLSALEDLTPHPPRA